VPINENDLASEDGVLSSLIRNALIKAFARRADLSNDGRSLLWKKGARERRKYLDSDFLIHDAIVVYLRRFAGRNYVVLNEPRSQGSQRQSSDSGVQPITLKDKACTFGSAR
jgi:hypothetical protein